MSKILCTGLFIVFITNVIQAQIWESHVGINTPQQVLSTSIVNDSVIWMVATRLLATEVAYDYTNATDYFMRSTDGGQTWTSGQIPFGDNHYPGSISAISRDTAWAISANWNTGGGKVLKTTNGGLNWSSVAVPFVPNMSFANWIHFFDSQRGLCGGDPRAGEFEIYRTENGGTNWTSVPYSAIPNPLTSEIGLIGIYDTKGDTIWYSTSAGRIFRSNNAGQTWGTYTPGIPSGLVPYPAIGPNGHAVVGYYNNSQITTGLKRTLNNGTTWSNVSLPLLGHFRLTDLCYIPGSGALLLTGRVLNLSGPFYTWISYNDGSNWQQIDEGNSVQTIQFLNPALGWGGISQFNSGETFAYRYAGSPLVGLLNPQPINVSLSLSPNPTPGLLQIEVSAEYPENYLLLVNDLSGRLIHKSTIENQITFQRTIDLSDCPSGVYVVTLSSAKGVKAVKVTKQ